MTRLGKFSTHVKNHRKSSRGGSRGASERRVVLEQKQACPLRYCLYGALHMRAALAGHSRGQRLTLNIADDTASRNLNLNLNLHLHLNLNLLNLNLNLNINLNLNHIGIGTSAEPETSD